MKEIKFSFFCSFFRIFGFNFLNFFVVIKKEEEAPEFDKKIERLPVHTKEVMDWLKRYKRTVKPDYLYLPEEKRARIELSK